jgi:hypothetical protein
MSKGARALLAARVEVFDNGVRGSGQHGREARRVSKRERANQFWRAADRYFNGVNGMSEIEHMRSGIARVDGNAARVAGASTGQCE